MALRVCLPRPAGWSGLIALSLALSVVACHSEQDRFDDHLRRASAAMLEIGAEETAVIELLSALDLRPASPEVNTMLGETLQKQGMLGEAIFYYEEAHHLAPARTRPAVALALLLRSSDPSRAAAMVEAVREQDAENPWVHAAHAELALDRESPLEAIRSASRSTELNPNFAFGHWALGSAHMGQIRIAQILGERADEEHFLGAQAAFERYAELTPSSERWNSLLERARVFAAWPGHPDDALATFREAMVEANEHAPRSGKLRVAAHVLEFARARANDPLREDALERLLELEPEHLAYWDELARVREISSGAGGETLAQLVEQQPDNAEAHLRYAGYLRATEGSSAAIEHLVAFSDDEALRPILMGALIDIYDADGNKAERDEALRVLEQEYPFHPLTAFSRAKLAFRRGQAEDAVRDLRSVVKRGAREEALLAYAEFSLGHFRRALRASSRAIEQNPQLEADLLELRAQSAYALGDCGVAGRSMLQLLSEDRLAEQHQVLLARCFYRSGQTWQGRKLLRTLLSKPVPRVEAILEFTRREMDNPSQRKLIRRKLASALKRDPGSPRLVLALAEAQRQDGLIPEAIGVLDAGLAATKDEASAKLLLARAGLHAERGDMEAAKRDAVRAFELDPTLPSPPRFTAAALAEIGRYDDAIAILERRREQKALSPDRSARLGNLYLKAGRRAEGRAELLRAYEMGCRSTDVLNTLAFMLAKDGQSLELALEAALLAAQQSGESPNSLDTLGYVNLRLGRVEVALGYFQRAVEESSRPDSNEPDLAVAAYHFRLGLALRALGRQAEASSAFQRAHSLDPTRPLSPPATPTPRPEPSSDQANTAPR